MRRSPLCHRRSCCWSDLPHDLLGDIILRLPGYGDRLRFRAVCHQWRRAERSLEQEQQPPPPMPWLAASGHCVGVHDAAVHRVALPEDARAAACRGSFGNWLAMVPTTTMSSPPPYHPFLLNAFTGARIQLPPWTDGATTISKIVLSSAPDDDNSGDKCIITVAAVVSSEFHNNTEQRRGSISVCRLNLNQHDAGAGSPSPSSSSSSSSSPWWCIAREIYLKDIAFFEGNLHAVDGAEKTYVFDDEELEKMRSRPLFRRDPVVAFTAHTRYYLVACNGRLLMVRRSFGTSRVPGDAHHQKSVGFRVSVVTEHCYGRTPVPVKCFDGHALFVGEACCGAFAVTDKESSKIMENQICYSDDETVSNTNTSSLLIGIGGDRRPSSVQSYDMRTDCFRRYQRRPGHEAGPWQCVTAQRLLKEHTMPPPVATEWGDTLLLWEVMACLGARRAPYYDKRSSVQKDSADDTYDHVVSVNVLVYYDWLSFTKRGRSLQEAKQEVAREAVTFLRSRFRAVLDDSPWSSVPYYHSHVSEDDAYDDEDYLEFENN